METRRARGRPRHADSARRTGASDDALHGAAMLRLALELKKPGSPPVDLLVSQLASSMRLNEASFRRFLAQQGELFTALATGRG